MNTRVTVLCSLLCAANLIVSAETSTSSTASIDCVEDGAYLHISPYAAPSNLLTVDTSTKSKVVSSTSLSSGLYSIWILDPAEYSKEENAGDFEGVYNIYNPLVKKYIGKISASGELVALVDKEADAGRYLISAGAADATAVAIKDVDAAAYLYCDPSSDAPNLVSQTDEDQNTLFFLESVTDVPTSSMDVVFDGAYIYISPYNYGNSGFINCTDSGSIVDSTSDAV